MAYATLPELRAYLNIATADTADDVLLGRVLNNAQSAIDTYCGWQFEAHTATRLYDSEADVVGSVLNLDEPLLSITTLTNGDADVLTAAEYFLLPHNSVPKWGIQLRPSTGLYWTYTTDHEQAISVVGTWGYSATAPADVQQACLRWAGYMYRQRDAQVFDVTAQPSVGILTIPQGMPKDVKVLLDNYKRIC